jgi:outer membrane protein TolC
MLHKITTYKLILGLLLVSIAGFSQSQEPVKHLKLEEAIEKAYQQNRAIQLAKMDETIAGSRLKQTDALYLPQVGLSYTAMSTNNPLNAFGFKLQQKSITAADFYPDLLNNPKGTPDFSTKLEVMQPIINLDLLYQKKAAEKQAEMYQYQTQRTKEAIFFEVKKAYLQLGLIHASIKVLEEALSTSKKVENFTDNRFKQGLLQKSDLLNAQLQVKSIETNLAKAKSNLGNASDFMSLLMGNTAGQIYAVDEIPFSNANQIGMASTPSAERADFMAMQKAIDATDLNITATKKSYLPKLNAFGSYQLNDSRMLGFGANAYLAGVQLSWDIFKGNRTKNNIATQVLEKNKMSSQLQQLKDQAQLELGKTYRDLNNASYQRNQQEKAVEQAFESLRILQNRYEQGLVNTTDVLMASTQLAQQQLALIQASYDKQISLAQIEFMTASNKK